MKKMYTNILVDSVISIIKVETLNIYSLLCGSMTAQDDRIIAVPWGPQNSANMESKSLGPVCAGG